MNGAAIPHSAVELLHEQLPVHELPKALTGIRGLDEVTRGGLPKGRPTLVCGGPGSGKTLLALTFLVNGAVRFDEPGVLLTFEENAERSQATSRPSASTFRSWSRPESWPSTTCASSAARSRKRASTISKGCSSGSTMPFGP